MQGARLERGRCHKSAAALSRREAELQPQDGMGRGGGVRAEPPVQQ